MRSKQRGLGLLGLIFSLVIIVLLVIGGTKLVPAYIEYFTVKKVLATMASGGDLSAGTTAADVRKSFDRRMQIEYIDVISGRDLTVSKESDMTVASFAYQKVVPLFFNVSLLIAFDGSSKGTRARI